MPDNPTTPDAQVDILGEVLTRIQKGELPQSPFELLHHPQTRKVVIAATRETMNERDMANSLLNQAPMNPFSLLEILTKGKGFQGRDREAAEGIITAEFIASVEKHVAACLAPRSPGDRMHDLLVRIPVIVEELTSGNHPMTLAEVQLFEERTRGKFQVHRDTIAKDGKKPEYTGLVGHENVVQFMHRNIGNTVWINLMLAAIEADDYEAIPTLLAEAPVGNKSKDIQTIMKYILYDPVLQVSPSMLNAITDNYKEYPGCLACVGGFIKTILENPDLNCYRPCIAHLGQLGLRSISRTENAGFMLQVFQTCTGEEIRGILLIDPMTNMMREDLERTISVSIQLLQHEQDTTPIYGAQINLLKDLAQEFQFELSANVK